VSYILDALRKLEQNRLHEESLTFLAFQGQTPSKSKRRRLWPYLLFAALVLNAGVIFWWIEFRQSPGPTIPAQKPAVHESKSAIEVSGPAAVGGESRVGKDIKESPNAAGKGMAVARSVVGQAPTPQQTPITEPTPTRKQIPNRQQAPVTELKPTTQQAAATQKTPITEPAPAAFETPVTKPPVRAEVAPPVDGKVLKLADLPPSIAGGLPELRIAIHYYTAEPESRFVLINDRTLREGEYLSEGLKVEQINRVDVVMNYRGWRFQIDVSGSR
jgi:general secretion pathway protein B